MVSTALKGRSGSGHVFKRVLNWRWKVKTKRQIVAVSVYFEVNFYILSVPGFGG